MARLLLNDASDVASRLRRPSDVHGRDLRYLRLYRRVNMRINFVAAALVAAAGFATSAMATNLVVNGSFDATPHTDKVTFEDNVAGWTGGANLTFLAGPGTAADGSYLSVYAPFPTISPNGGNFVLADGDPNYSGAFSQTLSGLTVGHVYAVEFYQAAGQQAGFTGITTERWSVTFGGVTQLSTLITLPEAGFAPWQKQSLSFTATAVSQVLTFLAVGTPGGAPPISFLDGVSVAGVPEPATWGLMVAGFGLVGFVARRRRVVFAA